MIRVVLVDDQTLVRQGVRGLLELVPDIEVVGEASDGEEALEAAVSYTHLTLRRRLRCRSRWSPYH